MQCDEGLLRQDPQDVAASTASSATGKWHILNKQIRETFGLALFRSLTIVALGGEITITNYIIIFLGCKVFNIFITYFQDISRGKNLLKYILP